MPRHVLSGLSRLLPAGWLFVLVLGLFAAGPAGAQGAFRFAGTIIDANSQRPLVAEVVIYGAAPEPVGKLQTDRSGSFTMSAETAGPYRFVVTALAYATQEITLSAAAPTSAAGPAPAAPAAFTARLSPLDVGTKVQLRSLQFAQSKSDLLPESFAELDRLVAVMKANPGLEIQINGHTDNQGKATANLALSENRVATVVAYIVRRGIAAARLRGQGFGGTQPIADNAQEATRQLNRRVEFEILKR
jgi:outer membrane protein OmpA-like peptidoglycan-associated protein